MPAKSAAPTKASPVPSAARTKAKPVAKTAAKKRWKKKLAQQSMPDRLY
jgi:hypothetical protein